MRTLFFHTLQLNRFSEKTPHICHITKNVGLKKEYTSTKKMRFECSPTYFIRLVITSLYVYYSKNVNRRGYNEKQNPSVYKQNKKYRDQLVNSNNVGLFQHTQKMS